MWVVIAIVIVVLLGGGGAGAAIVMSKGKETETVVKASDVNHVDNLKDLHFANFKTLVDKPTNYLSS